MNRIVAWVATIAVFLVVALGLYLGGSPIDQRYIRLDQQRIDGLRTISRVIEGNWREGRPLPENLYQLVDGRSLQNMPLDPETDASYEFNLIDENNYQLCAKFIKPLIGEKANEFWLHSAGRYCFNFEMNINNRMRRYQVEMEIDNSIADVEAAVCKSSELLGKRLTIRIEERRTIVVFARNEMECSTSDGDLEKVRINEKFTVLLFGEIPSVGSRLAYATLR